MKMKSSILAALAALTFTGSASSTHAAIVMVAEYRMGETGSIGTNNSPLDSATGGTPSGAQDLNEAFGATTSNTSIGTSGVSAPGSTAYLDTSDSSTGAWLSSAAAFSTLPTNNFGFGIYARAASLTSATQGDVFTLGGDNGAFKLSLVDGSGWAASAHNVAWIGNSGSFAPNSWVHLALVRTSGVTAFYVNGVQQGATYGGAPAHGRAHLAVNPGASQSFDGHLDEARVVTFDAEDAGVGNVNVLAALAIPEPSAAALAGLAGLGLLRRRRRA